MNMPAWRGEVLGPARLHGPGHDTLSLERKLAACLTYLALEGPTPRTRLVGLLWPDSPEATARNNLSQMLRRLRLTTGADLIVGTEQVRLAPGVAVDACAVRDLAAQGRPAELLAQGGELLAGLPYDDCPDFADWLTAERERFLEWRTGALRSELTRLEREGEYAGALTHARAMLDLDPVSEEVWRHLMRLHYMNGDRPAALSAYHRCQEVLRREFGVEPLPETAELAREIERGTVPKVAPSGLVALPLAVQRPPNLVGREAEWAQMQTAWATGKGILLGGPPGVGKTRLAQEFLASLGPYARIDARPGDANVPYSTFTRSYRERLAAGPPLDLPGWVREELARLFPEFGPPPLPITSEEQKLRFFSAVAALVAAARYLTAGEVYDDIQYLDAASAELGVFIASGPSPSGGPPRPPILTYRTGELPPAFAALLQSLVDSGQAIRIELEPLGEDGLDALMTDLGVPADPAARARLRDHSGGNPLFLLETVRHLIETGQLEGDLPERLPLPSRVGQLLERRLALLSPAALGAARGAAVLQSDVTIELVSAVLGAPLLDTAAAWEELEAAQVMAGERFSHDLVQEAVRAGIAPSVRRLLNRSAARILAGQGASPARVARHWLDGGDAAQAAPWLVRAAEAALASFRLWEASRFFGQAGELFRTLGEQELAFSSRLRAVRALLFLSDRTAAQDALSDLLAVAVTPEQHAQAWLCQADLHARGQEGEAAERAARTGLEALGDDEDPVRPKLMATLAAALSAQGRASEAARGFQAAVSLLERGGPSPELARTLGELAVTLDGQDRHLEATPYHERACAMLEALDDRPLLAVALRWRSDNLFDLGHVREGLRLVRRAFDLEAGSDASTWGTSEGHAGLAQAHMDLGEFAQALTHFGRAIEADTDPSAWRRVYHGLCLGELWLLLGEPERARSLLATARDCLSMPGRYRSRAYVAWSALPSLAATERQEALEAAERLLGDEARPLARLRVLLAQAAVWPGEQAHDLARRALSLARVHELGGFEVAALTRAAQTALALRRLQEAREHAAQALSLLSTREPAEMTRGEVYWTGHLVWRAEHRSGPSPALAQAAAWVRETSEHNVPPPHREGFLQRNALVRRILEAADTVAPADL